MYAPHYKLQSKHRAGYPSGNPSYFKLDVPEVFRDCRYQLNQVNIPFSAYTIHAYNNRLEVKEGLNDHVIALPLGYYDSNSICTLLMNEINAVSVGLVASIVRDVITNKLTITATSIMEVIIPANVEVYDVSINSLIGFTVTQAQALSLVGDKQVLLGNAYGGLNILISECPVGIEDVKQQAATFYVPVNANPGDQISYSPDVNFPQTCYFPVNSRQITVRLLDDNMRLVDLGGSEWSLILRYCNQVEDKPVGW